MIACENLTRRFGHFTAVDHVSFPVGQGSGFRFLGPDGSGKDESFAGLQGFSQRWIVLHKFCDEEIVSSLVNFADGLGEGDDFAPRQDVSITVLILSMLFIDIHNTASPFPLSGLHQGIKGGKQVVRAIKQEFRRI